MSKSMFILSVLATMAVISMADAGTIDSTFSYIDNVNCENKKTSTVLVVAVRQFPVVLKYSATSQVSKDTLNTYYARLRDAAMNGYQLTIGYDIRYNSILFVR